MRVLFTTGIFFYLLWLSQRAYQINSITRWNVLKKLVWLQGPEESCLLTPDILQSTARQIVQQVLPAKTTIRQCLYRVLLFYY